MLTFQLKTVFTPDVSGAWEMGLGVAGQADLYVDGEKVVDNSSDQKAGLLFVSLSTLLQQTRVLKVQFTTGAEERTAEYTFEAGRAYDLEVRFSNFKPLSAQSPYVSVRQVVPTTNADR